MYLQETSLLPVVKELASKGWCNKLRTTKKGQQLGGRSFDKSTLHQLLTNPIYTGKMRYKDELHAGEHEAIIDQELFDRVQQQLKQNGRSGGVGVRNKYGALLRGLLYCKDCGAAMSHTFTNKGDQKSYRYYRCTHAIKNGHDVCSTGTLPAGEIERVVIDEIRGLTKDESLLAQVLTDAHAAIDAELAVVNRERDDLCRERKRHHEEIQKLATGEITPAVTGRLADLQTYLSENEKRLPELESRMAELESQTITHSQARAVFADFDSLWDNLAPREQARLIHLLISKVEYDGKNGTVSVTFRPTSIRTLIDQNLEDAA